MSAVIVTPLAASSVPMPASVTSHSLSSATAEVIVVGGGPWPSPAAIRSRICSAFMPPSTPITTRRPTTASAMRFFMSGGSCGGAEERGVREGTDPVVARYRETSRGA